MYSYKEHCFLGSIDVSKQCQKLDSFKEKSERERERSITHRRKGKDSEKEKSKKLISSLFKNIVHQWYIL